MDLYTANEATNNDNYLSSTDNQNYQNIDLYTSNEAFNDNYLISTSTEIQNNEPNFTNEAFKDNDLLLTDNQNVDIYTQIKKIKIIIYHLLITKFLIHIRHIVKKKKII